MSEGVGGLQPGDVIQPMVSPGVGAAHGAGWVTTHLADDAAPAEPVQADPPEPVTTLPAAPEPGTDAAFAASQEHAPLAPSDDDLAIPPPPASADAAPVLFEEADLDEHGAMSTRRVGEILRMAREAVRHQDATTTTISEYQPLSDLAQSAPSKPSKLTEHLNLAEANVNCALARARLLAAKLLNHPYAEPEPQKAHEHVLGRLDNLATTAGELDALLTAILACI